MTERRSPDAIVQRLGALLDAMHVVSEDDCYDAMAAEGIPGVEADRAYKYTLVACGRQLLAGLGVTFSNGYFWLNGDGTIADAGELPDNPYFIAAQKLIATSPARWIGELGAMSADVAAVNQALHRGSKPENLVMAPAIFFLEPPTDEGMAKAHELLDSMARSSEKKPWWKFW